MAFTLTIFAFAPVAQLNTAFGQAAPERLLINNVNILVRDAMPYRPDYFKVEIFGVVRFSTFSTVSTRTGSRA
jgi:hypothetical protein